MRMTGQEELTALEQYIRSRSSKVKRSGNGIIFNCFYHNDNLPSASMKIGRNGMPMCYCSVCGSIYHQLKKDAGLWQDKSDSGGFTPFEKFLYYNTEDEYKMYDFVTEKYLCSHFRMKDKEKQGFPRGIRDGEHVTKGTDGVDTTYAVFCNGHLKEVKNAIEKKSLVCYTEGEKDTKCLWNNDCISFTCGGTNTFKKELLPYLKGGRFAVFGDNDRAGIADAERITALLNTVGTATMIIPPEVPEKGDISDYMKKHTKEDLQTLIENALNKSTVKETVMEGVAKHNTPIKAQGQQDSRLEQVLKNLHAERYETSDKGFGRLFADVFKDKHRYNPSRKDFMRYDGKRWIDDIEGVSARASAKALSDALVRYVVNVDTEGKYLKAVAALCNIRNRNNMLQDSKDVYFFSNEQLDVNDYLLNLQNGTLDLSGDKPVFLSHGPDMLLSKICNAEYDPAADCKEWKKFLLEIMRDDKEKILYLQKIAGLSLTGNTEQETCFILYGSTTRNGKSTFCETLLHLLGDYSVTMKPESLAVRQNLDSRTASGDIARLAGCRFCNASEPPKRMLFDTALLKSLLGRDSITARHLYQRETTFIPKFKLVINTNFLPTITDDTVFSSGRINVISFDRHFEPQEQDKDLKNRLRDKQELSGILNWCIEGLQLYRKEGLKPPAAVQTATDTYRTDSDKVGNFINECLAKTGRNSKAKDVYEAYTKWCDDNGYGCENKGNFFAELKTKGLFMNSGTVDGKTVRNIVKGYTIETDFIKYDGQEPLPFD